MVKVVGVRFKKAGKIYYFDPDETEIQRGDSAIVETARGVEFGSVVVGPKEIEEDEIVSPLKKVLRIANEEDLETHKQNRVERDEAFKVCSEKVIEHELDMKLIDVEYTFDRNKLIFYFTADGRIDFRELVKDLASVFRTRIELRQIGVRDEAKMLNGIGQCGRSLCCANWLGDFAPVSIKMAKDQSLSLNPTKISGICGRLMCCLKYEHETYLDLKVGFPNDGDVVVTPSGQMAKVVHTTLLKGEVKCRLFEGEDKNGRQKLSDDVIAYTRDELRYKNGKSCCKDGKVVSIETDGFREFEQPTVEIDEQKSKLVESADGKKPQPRGQSRKPRDGGNENKEGTKKQPYNKNRNTRNNNYKKPSNNDRNRNNEKNNRNQVKDGTDKPQKAQNNPRPRKTEAVGEQGEKKEQNKSNNRNYKKPNYKKNNYNKKPVDKNAPDKKPSDRKPVEKRNNEKKETSNDNKSTENS